jgi:cytochrome P450
MQGEPVTETDALPTLPFEQPSITAIPPLLRTLQDRQPITRVRTPAGDPAWLVTRYDEVKQLLADPRLGRSHPDPEHAPRISDAILFSGPMGDYDTEDADHAQMRALLTPHFSAKRMRALRPRVETLTTELLDALTARPRPVDLHQALSVPLPVLVICELLGVPAADRAQFRAWSQAIADLHDRQQASTALAHLTAYMHELVAHKRHHPGEDVISGLCAAAGGRLADQHVASLAAMLLFAGHETTVVRIDMGVVLLLTHLDQHQALLHDPAQTGSAVEEVLRCSMTGGGGLPRYARADLEVAGVTIRTGEAVLLDPGAANHDPRAFDHPDRFDVTRQPNPHLTFAHGGWFCIGAPLARMELQAVFTHLVPRLPTLRLAVPVEDLRVRSDLLTGGLTELPVTW